MLMTRKHIHTVSISFPLLRSDHSNGPEGGKCFIHMSLLFIQVFFFFFFLDNNLLFTQYARSLLVTKHKLSRCGDKSKNSCTHKAITHAYRGRAACKHDVDLHVEFKTIALG